MNFENLKDMKEFCKYNKIDVASLLWDTCEKSQEKIEALKAENESLTKQLDNKCETRTFPLELQYGDLTNYIGYGQSETEKLVAISFGVLKEKGEYFGENKPTDESKVLFVAYFDRTESLEVLENIVNIGKARLKELSKESNKED